MTDDLFTEDELKALDLAGELAGVLHRIVLAGGVGDNYEDDWNELAANLHVIQRAILAQVGARAYPSHFRPLGAPGVIRHVVEVQVPPHER